MRATEKVRHEGPPNMRSPAAKRASFRSWAKTPSSVRSWSGPPLAVSMSRPEPPTCRSPGWVRSEEK
eukprot:4120387-Prymnesium_polylepis.1